jgi:hypothetical protein
VKKLIYISFLLSIGSLLVGAEVDLNKAQRVAGNIFIERSEMANTESLRIQDVEVVNENSNKLMYIFHLKEPGFVIVSADDRVIPLLAFSFENPFNMENMPTNLSWMVDAYKEMIASAINSNVSATEEVNNEWNKYLKGNNLNLHSRNAAGPLLISKINQTGGWNDYCPDGGCSDGDQVPNGCVAVSMTALMHYWSYPTTGYGSNSCYCGGYGTQSADFSDIIYDYASMGDAVSATDAAALLLWHAGVSVNMDYECEGSGSMVTGGYPSAEYSLKNNFNYKSSMYDVHPYSYSDAEWIDKLANEIDSNRPFIYVGYNDEGGHAWNCDGYDEEMFHMNWGWGGQSNGYFTIIGPDDPDGWGSGSYALINIEPESLNRPNLILESYVSSEIDGDGDQVINPGESFDLVFSIANPEPWSDASSIDIILTTAENGLTIDESTSSIFIDETLNAGDVFTNASMPFIVDVDADIELGHKYFTLIVMGVGIEGAEDNLFFKEYELMVDVSLNQFGYPIYNASQKTSPLAVDLDNDGIEEIIYGDYNGFVHVLNADGTIFGDGTFPFETGNQIWGAAASADLDGDGLTDFTIPSKSKHLYIFDKNGLKVDYDAEKYLLGTPAIGNIDDDSDLEIIFSGYSSSNKVFAINPDGSEVAGFPYELGEKVKIGVALADFNGNGKVDIVVGTDSDKIHLIYDDGTEAPGFPVLVGDKVQSAPSILEVDGSKVIFVGCNDDNLYAINSDGSLRFSILTTDKVFNSPAFIEYNNSIYIFFSDDNGMLYAVDTDGNALDGWPIDAGAVISKSVAFSDMNNDGIVEIITVTEMADVLAFNMDGSPYTDVPMGNEFTFTASPLIHDMDGDGDLEILAGSTNSLIALDIKSSGSTVGYWNMYRGNTQRTGYYDGVGITECGAAMGDVTGDGVINILDLVQVVNYILELSTPMYECAADYNQDGTVNILDLVQIANNILDN